MSTNEILLITDSHLTEHCSEKTVFFSVLEKISETDYDVLFLGDIFDVWIGFSGYETDIHRDFMSWCLREKSKRNLWFIEGNHEFFIHRNRKEYFTAVYPDFAVLDGGALYAVHGDKVNYHDKAFALLRGILRNPFSCLLMKLFGYTGFGGSFSGKVRKDLQTTNQVQKRYFPEKELIEFEMKLKPAGIQFAVMGHFHLSEDVGSVTLLENFTGRDSSLGIYTSGKGIRRVTVREFLEETE